MTVADNDVVALRKVVQSTLNIGITEAQRWCAEAVCFSFSAWKHWERGIATIHPGTYKLACIEVERLERTARIAQNSRNARNAPSVQSQRNPDAQNVPKYSKGDLRRMLAVLAAIHSLNGATLLEIVSFTGLDKKTVTRLIEQAQQQAGVQLSKKIFTYHVVDWGPIIRPDGLLKLLLVDPK